MSTPSFFDLFNTNAQTAAANAQATGINAGYSQLADLYATAQQQLQTNYTAGLQPFQKNYYQANRGAKSYADLLGLGGPTGTASALTALENTPGYKFTLGQINNQTNATAAKGGYTGSGNLDLALQQNAAGLASQTYQNAVQNAGAYLPAQQAAASGIGGLYSGLGSGQAGINTGQGTAALGAQASIGNAYANAQLAALTAGANQANFGMNLGAGLLGFASKIV